MVPWPCRQKIQHQGTAVAKAKSALKQHSQQQRRQQQRLLLLLLHDDDGGGGGGGGGDDDDDGAPPRALAWRLSAAPACVRQRTTAS